MSSFLYPPSVYEVCRSNTVRVIALQGSVDGRTDRQTDKVITIGLPHLRWWGPNQSNPQSMIKILKQCNTCTMYISTKQLRHQDRLEAEDCNVPISRLFFGVHVNGFNEQSVTVYPCSFANIALSVSTRFMQCLPGK